MSAFTRIQIETLLINRCGSLLIWVGKDGATVDGTNSDLNDAIGGAIRRLEGTVANPLLVSDTDVQTVDTDLFDALLDISELRVYFSIRGNLTTVDITAGPFSDKFSNIGDYLEDQIKTLAKRVADEHGIGGVEAEMGVLIRDIASHDESRL